MTAITPLLAAPGICAGATRPRAHRPLCGVGQILHGASAGQAFGAASGFAGATPGTWRTAGRRQGPPEGGSRSSAPRDAVARDRPADDLVTRRESDFRQARPASAASFDGFRRAFDRRGPWRAPFRGYFSPRRGRGLTRACTHGSAEPCYSARNAGRRVVACRGATSGPAGSAAPGKKLQETLP